MFSAITTLRSGAYSLYTQGVEMVASARRMLSAAPPKVSAPLPLVTPPPATATQVAAAAQGLTSPQPSWLEYTFGLPCSWDPFSKTLEITDIAWVAEGSAPFPVAQLSDGTILPLAFGEAHQVARWQVGDPLRLDLDIEGQYTATHLVLGQSFSPPAQQHHAFHILSPDEIAQAKAKLPDTDLPLAELARNHSTVDCPARPQILEWNDAGEPLTPVGMSSTIKELFLSEDGLGGTITLADGSSWGIEGTRPYQLLDWNLGDQMTLSEAGTFIHQSTSEEAYVTTSTFLSDELFDQMAREASTLDRPAFIPLEQSVGPDHSSRLTELYIGRDIDGTTYATITLVDGTSWAVRPEVDEIELLFWKRGDLIQVTQDGMILHQESRFDVPQTLIPLTPEMRKLGSTGPKPTQLQPYTV